MIALVVMTDGRGECLAESVRSYANLVGPITRRVIHDDSGDRAYRRKLDRTYPWWTKVYTPGRSGFDGAVRSAWRFIRAEVTEPYVFVTEDDFTIDKPIDLTAMAEALEADRNLAQIVLKRQAWNSAERAAGGIVEQHPGDYIETTVADVRLTTHRRFFSTNPYLARREFIVENDWPSGAHSEGRFTHLMLEQRPGIKFAFLGGKFAPPTVTHIGTTRVGTGY